MLLDDLDEQLLRDLSSRFPKPDSLEFCEYDVTPAEVEQLCQHPRPFEVDGLIPTFVAHNRLGMFGGWRDFPFFAGDVAVYCRRASLRLEYDLAFFHLHASEYGKFNTQDAQLLKAWVEDILLPWRRPLARNEVLEWWEHALGYLALYCTLGGNTNVIVTENIARSQQGAPTELVRALAEFFTDREELDATRVLRHFEGMATSADNQELPSKDFVRRSSVAEMTETLEKHGTSIIELTGNS